MCVDPVTAIMIGGTALSAAGSVAKGNAEAGAYGAKADQYDSQASLLHRQAGIEQMTSGYTQRRKIEQNQNLQGQQTIGYGANGLLSDSGSAADVATDTAREEALDIGAIQWNSQNKSTNLNLEGSQASNNAKNARRAATTAQETGWLGAATSVATAFGPTKYGGGQSLTTRLGLKF